MLLKLLAYTSKEQTKLLPAYWEIEHIFPQTWDSKYFNLDEDDTNDKLEHLGNKLPLEKKLNISASNNYFATKKEKYKKSEIAICANLGNSSLASWTPDNIVENDSKIAAQVKQLFLTWVADYEPTPTVPSQPEATPEELEMIKKLRERGLI